MFSSHIPSRLLRFWLLGVFIVGLFVSIGEVSVDHDGTLSLSQGGIYTVVAIEGDATPAAGEKKVEGESKTIEAFIDVANLFIGVLTFLITPLIMLAGWLLSPDWTFGEIFWLRPILHQIWIFISNIVYVIFGFFLVFIAFANIFGWESAKTYEMKSMLPKLVTGILIVPFTWFIVSAVLSISNILTASVIQLPIDTIQKAGSAGTFLDDKIIPREITYDKDRDYKQGTVNSFGNSTTDSTDMEYKANGNFYATDCDKGGNDCLSIQEFLSNGKGGAYNLLSVYAYGIFKIQNYKFITNKEKLSTLGGIASKLSFSFLFFIVFGILIIAIVYALLSRALILWLYAMFSPIFALNYVMDFKNESVKNSVGRMSITKFLSLALVPVYVSAALAFGLMFLGLVMNAKGNTLAGAGWLEWSLKWDIVEVETKNSISSFKFWDIKLTTKWVLTAEQNEWLNGGLNIVGGIIGTIIMNVLALVILWMAVMAALNADEVTKSAVAPIKSFGDEVGKLALKSPQYIPIPLPGGKSASMASLQSIWSMPQQALSSRAAAEADQFREGINKTFGGNIPSSTAIQNIKNRMHDGITQEEWPGIKKEYLDLVNKHGRTAPALKELEAEIIKNISANDKTSLTAADLNNLDKKTVTDDKKLAQALMWTDSAEQRKFLNATRPDNGLIKVENNYTVGNVTLNEDKKSADVNLSFGDKSGTIKIDRLDRLDKSGIVDKIQAESLAKQKKKLDTSVAEKLADDVIKKTKEAIEPKTEKPAD